VRQGNGVTLTTKSWLTYTSATSAQSQDGIIPSQFRPANAGVSNLVYMGSSIIILAQVTTSGRLILTHRNFAGEAANASSTVYSVTVPYAIG
jgi:hypothetical protein